MADITMCRGENCGKREQCYRYTAPVNPYGQSFMDVRPESGHCKFFWANDGRADGRRIGRWWKE